MGFGHFYVETQYSTLVDVPAQQLNGCHAVTSKRDLTMASPTGKLPQWWLDSTPHDTLEEQVERKKKEAEEKKAQEQQKVTEQNDADAALDVGDVSATQKETPSESLDMNGNAHDNVKPTPLSKSNGYRRNSNPTRTITPEEWESTDYNVERAKLKPVTENDMKKRNGALSPASSRGSPATISSGRYTPEVTSPQEQAVVPESALLSPESTVSSSSTPSSLESSRKPARHFKTSFTGVSPFDFAMQQRAREQERREKERLARESMQRHHAQKIESDKASQHKQKDLEEKRKKREAEENLKTFKKVTLESDLATELKRQQQEDKRKKKEAEELYHDYKSTS